MVKIFVGDLLKSDCDVIGHQCNCFSNMGAGIAASIKKMFPEAYEADLKFPKKPADRLGEISYAFSKNKYIFNLYGQFKFGRGQVQTQYPKLRSAMEKMMEQVIEIESETKKSLKVGLPYKIGSNLAGGNWNVVLDLIQQVSEKYNHDIFVYQLPGIK